MITPYQPAQPRYGSAAEFAKIIDAVTEQEVKPWHGENAEEKGGDEPGIILWYVSIYTCVYIYTHYIIIYIYMIYLVNL